MSSPDPTTDKNCIKLGGEKSRSMQSEIDSSNRDPSPKSSQGHRHQRRQCSSDRGDRDRPKTDKSNVMDLNTPNVFNFRACTPDESKALLETLVHKHERVERSAHQVIALNKTSTFAGVKARVWNAVRHKPLGQPETTWFSNTAVSALNKLGTWETGLLMLAYGSNAVTNGNDYGVVVFSIDPLRLEVLLLGKNCVTVDLLHVPVDGTLCDRVSKACLTAMIKAMEEKHIDNITNNSPAKGFHNNQSCPDQSNADTSGKTHKRKRTKRTTSGGKSSETAKKMRTKTQNPKTCRSGNKGPESVRLLSSLSKG